ncbi:FapA family protein [Paenibacillus filicis]|uniref:FapA family protein n=1 Tax=Paenibacillus filicis TaxID=669464 RepID=A0ABU9DMW2_9BACL
MGEMTMPLNYYLDVVLSDDKLTAFLQFTNRDEKFAATLEQLQELIRSYHVVHGVDQAILLEIVKDPSSFFYAKTAIATGQAPNHGADGQIRMLYDLSGHAKKPTEMEDGKVDYKEVTTFHNVRKGQLIAQRIPAGQGAPGRAVTGEVLFAKDGKEARFKLGKNVVTDPEQLALYAAIDGMVTKTDREKINVFPIFEVNGDVDYNIGNIDFVGSVVIRGSVLPGFRIKAAGDIRITGNVDGADLEAEGSIEISAGILGHNKAVVRAGKRVKCSFIQDATVEAGEEVLVTQSIMHSQIRAGRFVYCQGAKGLIVGGQIQAGECVIGRTVGNAMSTVTAIEVGVLPELRNEMQQLRANLRSYNENHDKTDKALVLLDQLAAAGHLTPDKVGLRIKLNHTKKQVAEDISNAKERIMEIEKSLEDSEQARVEVIGNVFSGTKIVIGRYTKFIKDTSPRVKFQLVDGDIAMMPIH